ncbi:hypothetical protein [Cryobacterium arcticum]|uniref:Uncharacterized protein n=1 Tax=Cryobacterium arcticum TaxID=670052 RepID=A0A1B1BKF5_9MICO|nr:hypothetical protein [Cryobacterium arcticum]ANP73035.1 hypothetical protein PA27867_2083 [Cryobacterium arcticum]
MLFEITVFSNPVTALVGEGGFLPVEELHKTAEYDEEFVKPALLLADKVTLRSHRVDLLSNEVRDHNTLGWPVPLLARAIGLSTRRDSDELTRLKIAESDLLTNAEIASIEAALDPESGEYARVIPDSIKRVESIRVALAAHYRLHGDMLTSEPLRALDGLLEELPWDPTPKSQPQKLADISAGNDMEFNRAFFTIVDDVVNSRTSVMMDDTVFGGVKRLTGEPAGLDSATVVRGAVELMRMVDGLSAMRLDEIPGVRSDLAPYLGPFRAFMLEVSESVGQDDASDAERSRQLLLAWERQVAPAVDELEAVLRSASFKRNAIDVFATRAEVLQTVGFALGIAAGAGLVGISSLTAGAALAPPMLEALVASVRAKQAARTNRAYFVHAMAARLTRGRA